mgnify:CR=1 FL=1
MTRRKTDAEIEKDKRRFLKKVTGQSSSRYSIGGVEKKAYAPRTITLPKLKCLETEGEDDN